MTDHQIIEAMRTFGGGFIRAVAAAYQAADATNQQRLKTAFATEWLHYAEIADLAQRRA